LSFIYPEKTVTHVSFSGVNGMSVRSKIITQFETVAREQNQKLPPLSDDLVLLESGLDSLCFAVIVARLDDELGFDPFTASEDLEFPVTFGDFVKIYENGAG
jgi:acyl carrier protein